MIGMILIAFAVIVIGGAMALAQHHGLATISPRRHRGRREEGLRRESVVLAVRYWDGEWRPALEYWNGERRTARRRRPTQERRSRASPRALPVGTPAPSVTRAGPAWAQGANEGPAPGAEHGLDPDGCEVARPAARDRPEKPMIILVFTRYNPSDL